MEAIGFKKRLEEAKKNKEIIKLIFQYPSSDRAIIRNGYVININEDSFDFHDRFDGVPWGGGVVVVAGGVVVVAVAGAGVGVVVVVVASATGLAGAGGGLVFAADALFTFSYLAKA